MLKVATTADLIVTTPAGGAAALSEEAELSIFTFAIIISDPGEKKFVPSSRISMGLSIFSPISEVIIIAFSFALATALLNTFSL